MISLTYKQTKIDQKRINIFIEELLKDDFSAIKFYQKILMQSCNNFIDIDIRNNYM